MLRRLLARRLGLRWHGGAETARDRCGGSRCLRSRDGEWAMLLGLAVLGFWCVWEKVCRRQHPRVKGAVGA
jgi:hypothetical protein